MTDKKLFSTEQVMSDRILNLSGQIEERDILSPEYAAISSELREWIKLFHDSGFRTLNHDAQQEASSDTLEAVKKSVPSGFRTLSPRAKRIIDLAYYEAKQEGVSYVGSHHILLGLLQNADGPHSEALASVDITKVREMLKEQEANQEGVAEAVIWANPILFNTGDNGEIVSE